MSVFVRLQRYIAAQNRRIKNERKRRWAQQQRRCNTGTAVKVACQCHRCASVKVYALSNVSSHPHRYKNVPRRNAVERKCERRTSSTVQCRATKVHMENNAEHRQCHGCVVAPLLCHRCNRTRSKFRGSILDHNERRRHNVFSVALQANGWCMPAFDSIRPTTQRPTSECFFGSITIGPATIVARASANASRPILMLQWDCTVNHFAMTIRLGPAHRHESHAWGHGNRINWWQAYVRVCWQGILYKSDRIDLRCVCIRFKWRLNENFSKLKKNEVFRKQIQ